MSFLNVLTSLLQSAMGRSVIVTARGGGGGGGGLGEGGGALRVISMQFRVFF